jgi:hypothetical protein
MANQAEPGMGGAAPQSAAAAMAAAQGSTAVDPASYGQRPAAATVVAGHAGPYPPFHGRRVSWIAISMVIAGFLVGGFAMIFGTGGTIWWLFWTGVGVVALGLLVALATNIFEDWY